MKAEIIKSQDEAITELNRALKSYKTIKQEVEQNLTRRDQLQRQIETLHVTKATLQSEISDIREKLSNSLFMHWGVIHFFLM